MLQFSSNLSSQLLTPSLAVLANNVGCVECAQCHEKFLVVSWHIVGSGSGISFMCLALLNAGFCMDSRITLLVGLLWCFT